MLKVALPTGKLESATLTLLNEANIPVARMGRNLILPIDSEIVREVRFVKPRHIPDMIKLGVCDVGICTIDLIEESGVSGLIRTILPLPYGQVGRDGKTKVVVFYAGGRIPRRPCFGSTSVVSEYPLLTREFFRRQNWPVEITISHGGTEALVPCPYTLGVCLMDTGETLRANGLHVFEVLLESFTVVIATRNSTSEKHSVIQELRRRLMQASTTLYH